MTSYLILFLFLIHFVQKPWPPGGGGLEFRIASSSFVYTRTGPSINYLQLYVKYALLAVALIAIPLKEVAVKSWKEGKVAWVKIKGPAKAAWVMIKGLVKAAWVMIKGLVKAA